MLFTILISLYFGNKHYAACYSPLSGNNDLIYYITFQAIQEQKSEAESDRSVQGICSVLTQLSILILLNPVRRSKWPWAKIWEQGKALITNKCSPKTKVKKKFKPWNLDVSSLMAQNSLFFTLVPLIIFVIIYLFAFLFCEKGNGFSTYVECVYVFFNELVMNMFWLCLINFKKNN